MKRFLSLTAVVTYILLALVWILISFETAYPLLHIPRVIIGSFVVLFVPGYWITRWAFPWTSEEKLMDPSTESSEISADDTPKTIDGLERGVLSVALSISSVPLVIFYVNFLGVPLTVWSVYWTLVGVTVVSMIATFYSAYRHDRQSK